MNSVLVKAVNEAGHNGFGDEGAFILARGIPGVRELWLGTSQLSLEGVVAVGSGLTEV